MIFDYLNYLNIAASLFAIVAYGRLFTLGYKLSIFPLLGYIFYFFLETFWVITNTDVIVGEEINIAWAIVELFTTLGPALLVNYFYKILETEKKHCLHLIKERELL
jgi:hypothetical protein